MNHDNPSTLGTNGQDSRGRFAAGNKLGRGNPLAGRAARIRAEVLKAAKTEDVKAIVRKLVEGAKAGDLLFIREWLDRCIGRPAQADLLERIERLELLLAERENPSGRVN